MPKVPRFKARSQKSLDVGLTPTESPRTAGMVHKSTQSLGEKVASIATSIGSEITKRDNLAKRNHHKNEFAINTENKINELERDAEQLFKDGNWEGYRDENMEEFKTFIDKQVENAPSGILADETRQKGDAIIEKMANRWDGIEKKQVRAFQRNFHSGLIDTRTLELRNNKNKTIGDAAKALEDSEINLKESIGLWEDAKSAATQRKRFYEFATSKLDGLLDEGDPGSLAQAERFLNGKDLTPSEQRLLTTLGAKGVTIYKNKLERLKQSAVSNAKKNVISELNAFLEIADNGIDTTNPKNALMLKTLDDNIVATFGGSDEGLRNRQKLWSSVSGGNVRERVATSTPEEITAMKNNPLLLDELKLKFPINAIAAKKEHERVVEDAAKDKGIGIANDPAAYFNKHDSKVRKLSEASLTDPKSFSKLVSALDVHYDREFGVGKKSGLRKYTTPLIREYFGGGIKRSLANREFGTALGLYNQIDAMGGNYKNQILNELGLPSNAHIIGGVNPKDREEAIRLSDSKVLDQLYEDKGFSTSKKDIRAIRDRLKDHPLYKVISRTGGGKGAARENANATLDLVLMKFKDLIIQNNSEESAIEKAWELFSDTNAIIGDDYSITVPKNINQDQVVKYLRHFTEELGPDDTSSPTKELGIFTSGQSTDANDAMIRKKGHWVDVPGEQRAELWTRDPLTNTMKLVVTNEGDRISVSYKDAALLAKNYKDIPEKQKPNIVRFRSILKANLESLRDRRERRNLDRSNEQDKTLLKMSEDLDSLETLSKKEKEEGLTEVEIVKINKFRNILQENLDDFRRKSKKRSSDPRGGEETEQARIVQFRKILRENIRKAMRKPKSKPSSVIVSTSEGEE